MVQCMLMFKNASLIFFLMRLHDRCHLWPFFIDYFGYTSFYLIKGKLFGKEKLIKSNYILFYQQTSRRRSYYRSWKKNQLGCCAISQTVRGEKHFQTRALKRRENKVIGRNEEPKKIYMLCWFSYSKKRKNI